MPSPTGPLGSHQVWVRPDYRLFSLSDPTTEEVENFGIARRAAAGDNVVGWSESTVVVNVTCDLIEVAFEVETWPGPPVPVPADDQAGPELVREHRLALPGGRISIPEAREAQFRLGVAVSSGPGTYRVRVVGYGRTRARQIWDDTIRRDGAFSEQSYTDLLGVERYRIQMWQVSPQPRWENDEWESP